MNRINKIIEGTIGSLQCEQSLNKILVELNDAKITNRTLRRYNYFKEGLKKLESLNVDPKFHNMMMALWKNHNFEMWKNTKVPHNVYTHLCCCMSAQYRLVKKERVKL